MCSMLSQFTKNRYIHSCPRRSRSLERDTTYSPLQEHGQTHNRCHAHADQQAHIILRRRSASFRRHGTRFRRQVGAVGCIVFRFAHKQLFESVRAKRTRTTIAASRHGIAQECIDGLTLGRRNVGSVAARCCCSCSSVGCSVVPRRWKIRRHTVGTVANLKVACRMRASKIAASEVKCYQQLRGIYRERFSNEPVMTRQAPRTPRCALHSNYARVNKERRLVHSNISFTMTRERVLNRDIATKGSDVGFGFVCRRYIETGETETLPDHQSANRKKDESVYDS
jgi:hypothetical protein